jgi:alpha-beta hydrolase superfamily lysophospholipase
MQTQENFFQNAKGEKIYSAAWLPEGEPKAAIVIVHGLAEHCGRYMNLVNHFVPHGYAVYGLDHIGHGKSEGQRVFVERFEDFITTLDQFVELVRAWQPAKPLFMVGHSMGGLIGANYLIAHQSKLTGAVLSGPGVKIPDSISPAVILLGKLLSVIAPRTGLLALDAKGVSRDPAVVQAYINDPLVFTGKNTARLAAELVKGIRQVNDQAQKINLPLLIVQGSQDTLVDPGGAPLLHSLVSSSDKTLKIYDGLYHEVFNEPEHEDVLADVLQWIEEHCP